MKKRFFLPVALTVIGMALTLSLAGCKEEKKEEEPAVDPDCVHVWTEATCTTPETCELCHAVNGAPLGHLHQMSEFRKPTCEANGYAIYTCTREGCADCGEHEKKGKDYQSKTCEACNHSYLVDETVLPSFKATEHGEYRWETVVDDNETLCEDGGQKIYVCGKCFDSNDPFCKICKNMVKESEEIDPTGHIVTGEWTLVTAPTLSTTGMIKGPFCSGCGKNDVTKTLPKLNKTDYTYNSKIAPKCDAPGTDEYIYSENGWTGTFEVRTYTYHTIDGVTLMNKDVYTVLDGVTAAANYEVTCAKEGLGTYVCYDCGNTQIVRMIGIHIESELVFMEELSYEPTCCKKGADVYFCPTCEQNITRTVDKLPHITDKIELVMSGKLPSKIKFICTNEGCNYNNTGKPYADVYNVKHCEEPIVTPAKCGVTEKTLYKITYTTPSGDAYIEHTIEGEAYDHLHRISETKVIELCYDGSHTYTYAELVSIFGSDLDGFTIDGEFPKACNITGVGVAICSDCKVALVIGINGDHAYNAGVYEAPTCTSPGKMTYTCTVAGCGHVNVVNISGEYPREHIYGNEITLNPTENEKGKLRVWCEREDCAFDKIIDLPLLTDKGWDATISTGSSCTSGSYTIYTFENFVIDKNSGTGTVATANISFSVYRESTKEHKNSGTYVTWTDDKTEYKAYYCPECNNFVVVETKEIGK